MQGQARHKDRGIPDHGPKNGVGAGAHDSERAEVDGEVEVGAGEGLDDGEAEQEVAGRDPAFVDDVFAQQGDHDRAAAEDDCPGQVEVGEEAEAAGWAEEGATEDHDRDEG